MRHLALKLGRWASGSPHEVVQTSRPLPLKKGEIGLIRPLDEIVKEKVPVIYAVEEVGQGELYAKVARRYTRRGMPLIPEGQKLYVLNGQHFITTLQLEKKRKG